VRAVLAVSEDLEDAHRVLAVADEFPQFVIPALGVHPDRAALVSDEEVAGVESLIREHAHRLGAIGEVGLDHRPIWNDRARSRQAEVLRHMCRIAHEVSLPLSVHSRGAGKHAIALIEEESCSHRACLHAFDGRAVFGERGAELGFRFSIPPSVVRSRVKQKLVPRLPEGAILLESDAPVLGPEAGTRNEPANVRIGLEEVARLRGGEVESMATAIAATTGTLFPRLVTLGDS